MIDPCPVCGKVPEPVKPSETLFVWKISCCGLSVISPWFIGVLTAWRDLVAMYEKVKP